MKRFRLIISVIAILALAAVPAVASAKVADTYRGWGKVAPATAGAATAPAWRWYNYYGWWGTTRNASADVWIQPFATGWSWTWNSGRGWLAMRTSDLSDGTITPVDPNVATGAHGTAKISFACPFNQCDDWSPSFGLKFTWNDAANGNLTTDVKTTTVWTTTGSGAYTVNLKPGTYKVTADLSNSWSSSIVVPATGHVVKNFTINMF